MAQPTEKPCRAPTWQYLAGLLMTIVLFFAAQTIIEARTDIRKGSELREQNTKQIIELSGRVSVLESVLASQAAALTEWKIEQRERLNTIEAKLDKNGALLAAHERRTAADIRRRGSGGDE